VLQTSLKKFSAETKTIGLLTKRKIGPHITFTHSGQIYAFLTIHNVKGGGGVKKLVGSYNFGQ
jgi:hypothetical protein